MREERERYPFVATYIVASGRNGTLYLGVTSNLAARVMQHKKGLLEGFSKTHGCTRLVWFERHASMKEAIARETRLKGWRRKWKLDVIEEDNPDWRDLSDGWYDETTSLWLLNPNSP